MTTIPAHPGERGEGHNIQHSINIGFECDVLSIVNWLNFCIIETQKVSIQHAISYVLHAICKNAIRVGSVIHNPLTSHSKPDVW